MVKISDEMYRRILRWFVPSMEIPPIHGWELTNGMQHLYNVNRQEPSADGGVMCSNVERDCIETTLGIQALSTHHHYLQRYTSSHDEPRRHLHVDFIVASQERVL